MTRSDFDRMQRGERRCDAYRLLHTVCTSIADLQFHMGVHQHTPLPELLLQTHNRLMPLPCYDEDGVPTGHVLSYAAYYYS